MPEEILRIIHAHLTGQASGPETAALRKYLEENPDKREQLATLGAITSSLSILSDEEGLQHSADRAKQTVNARIDTHEKARRRRRTVTALCSGAAACILLALGFFLLHKTGPDGTGSESGYLCYTNDSVAVKSVILPDSSVVLLQNGARLKWTENLLGSREVALSGNAYFDIKPNVGLPFNVATDNMTVRVLGTTFAVEATPAVTEVILETGSVAILNKDGVKLVRLFPDQKAVCNGTEVTVSQINSAPYMVQHYNKISLHQASIAEITEVLKGMYNIEIRPVGTIDTSRKYNINYNRNDSITQIVRILEALTGVEFETGGTPVATDGAPDLTGSTPDPTSLPTE